MSDTTIYGKETKIIRSDVVHWRPKSPQVGHTDLILGSDVIISGYQTIGGSVAEISFATRVKAVSWPSFSDGGGPLTFNRYIVARRGVSEPEGVWRLVLGPDVLDADW